MNKIDVSLFIEKISDQQSKLTSILHEGVGSILIPNDNNSKKRSIGQESASSNKKNMNGVMIVSGGAVAVAGLFVSSPVKWLLFGAGASAIVYGCKQKTSGTQASKNTMQMNDSVNYDELVSRINRGLSSVNRNIFNTWDEFVVEQKNQLKNYIMQLDVDVDKKDSMMNFATKTVAIEFTMSSLYLKLNNAAKNQSTADFKDVCAQFEDEYKQAIDKACSEQIKLWSEINK